MCSLPKSMFGLNLILITSLFEGKGCINVMWTYVRLQEGIVWSKTLKTSHFDWLPCFQPIPTHDKWLGLCEFWGG